MPQCRFCDVGAITSQFERRIRHCCDRLSSRQRWGRIRGVSEAHLAAIGREEDRLAIHADVGRFGTDDPATWSMGDRLTFLELKLIDMLGSYSPKRSSVYRKLSILEVCFHHRHGSLDCSFFSKQSSHGSLVDCSFFCRARADRKSRSLSRNAKDILAYIIIKIENPSSEWCSMGP